MKYIGLVMSVVLLFSACRADDEVKKGGENDFCNFADTDCREGFVCQTGVCQALVSTGGVYSCEEMCTRLDSCNAGEADCVARCRATFRGDCEGLACPWSTEAIDAFGTCIVEGLTCEEARQADAPDTCYNRIPFDTNRRDRCDAFVAAADRCAEGVVTTALRSQCFLLGRTSTDESWSRTDGCVDRISDGICVEIADCFNNVFELSPLINLGSGTLGGTDVEF